MNNQEKLYEIAKYLKDLNKKGKVKGFKGNENGYAKIRQIVPGCSIWIHLEKNEDLIVDLLVSPSAKERNYSKCQSAINNFKSHFQMGLKESSWNHSIDSYRDHERYYAIINDLKLEQIFIEVDKIKQKFV